MFPDRPTKLDAALLYYDYKPFAYRDLAERLQKSFGDRLPVKLGLHEDGSFGVITAGDIVMKISQNPGPLGIEGFAAALMSNYTHHTKPDAANIVNNHRKNIFVTVGGDAILMPDLGDMPPEMADALAQAIPAEEKPNATLYANRVYVAQMTILELCKMNTPELIHWLQSDKFLTAREIDTANDPTAMALQMHPVLNSTGNDKLGRQMIGFEAFGSEHIIGHHVSVEETSLTFENVFVAVQGFVHAVHKARDLPASGKKVTLKTGAEFMVHHMAPDDKHPRPYVRLEVLKTGTASAKTNTAAKSTSKATSFALSLISKARNLIVVLLLALIFGKLLGGSDGLQLVTLLTN